jgi:hypothetical protein
MPLLLIVFALIAAIPAVFIVDGLLTGEVQSLGGEGPCSRVENPVGFWAMIVTDAALIIVIAYLAFDLAFFG